MKTSTIVWIVIVLIMLGGGWYLYSQHTAANMAATQSGTQNTPTTTAQSTQSPTTPTSNTSTASTNTPVTPLLSVSSNATLGSYLVASNGMTLYLYTPDKPGVSNCSGQCAVAWPPYTVSAGTQLTLATDLTGALATIVRADGTTQVTYKGMPLYFYVKDKSPGDTTGQGVGGVWYVVTP